MIPETIEDLEKIEWCFINVANHPQTKHKNEKIKKQKIKKLKN